MRVSSAGEGAFDLAGHSSRKVLLTIAAGQDFTPETARALPSIGIGMALALLLAIPYALPYLEAARTLPDRETLFVEDEMVLEGDEGLLIRLDEKDAS